MNRFTRLALPAVLVLAANVSSAAPAPSASDEIRAVRAAWNTACNASDIDRLIALYTEDAVSMPPGASASIGRRRFERTSAPSLPRTT